MRRVGAAGRAVLAAALSGVAVGGCAGASVEVSAARAQYPISMSGSVRDDRGVLLDARSLQRVGDFGLAKTRVGFLYSGVTLRSTLDISDDVNAQVTAVHGEAVIHLAVTVLGDCDFLNSLWVLDMLPFWPGCVPVSVDGVIVRRKPPAP